MIRDMNPCVSIEVLVMGPIDNNVYIISDGETTFTQRFGVAITGGATGISEITNAQHPAPDAYHYNLHGQRLSQPQKGLNIVNGKKVIY